MAGVYPRKGEMNWKGVEAGKGPEGALVTTGVAVVVIGLPQVSACCNPASGPSVASATHIENKACIPIVARVQIRQDCSWDAC